MSGTWRYALTAGGKWSGVVGRGKRIRFAAQEAGANVALLLYRADDKAERYNMPDTLKAQYTSHLTTGNVLMSDNGRALASIVEDDLGWHDPIGGLLTRETAEAKYGPSSYQERRNEYLKNGRDNVVVELVRNGLGARDLVPCVNLFSKIVCDDEGRMHYVEGHCPKGASVTLRLEMDVLLIVSNTPHPLDPRPQYGSVPVTIEVSDAEPVDPASDACVNHRGENRRAFENTWTHYALSGR